MLESFPSEIDFRFYEKTFKIFQKNAAPHESTLINENQRYKKNQNAFLLTFEVPCFQVVLGLFRFLKPSRMTIWLLRIKATILLFRLPKGAKLHKLFTV